MSIKLLDWIMKSGCYVKQWRQLVREEKLYKKKPIKRLVTSTEPENVYEAKHVTIN